MATPIRQLRGTTAEINALPANAYASGVLLVEEKPNGGRAVRITDGATPGGVPVGGTPDDGSVTQGKVTGDSSDPLRITISNLAYPRRYGTWDPTGAADSAPALQAAINSKRFVELGEGTFRLATAPVISVEGAQVIGAGRGATKLMASNPANDVLQVGIVGGALAYVVLRDFGLVRSTAPTGSAAGLKCLGTLNHCEIKDLNAIGHIDGLLMRGAIYGTISGCYSTANYRDGVRLTPASDMAALQWQLRDNFSENNDGCGFRVQGISSVTAGPSQTAMGEWVMNRTFGNTGGGMHFIGTSAIPVQVVRISGAFIGEDGSNEIYLGTYGVGHVIKDVYSELGGRVNTGRLNSTPPSGDSSGIFVDTMDAEVTIRNCTLTGHAKAGIITASAAAGTKSITGNTLTNNGTFGAFIQNGAGLLLSSNTVAGNTSGSVSYGANATSRVGKGNSPAALDA